MNLKEAIKDTFRLNSDKKEMHIDDITLYISESIADFKNIDIDVLKKKVNAVLANDLVKIVKGKRDVNKASAFVRVSNGKKGYKKGVYALRPEPKQKPIIEVDKFQKGRYNPEIPILFPLDPIKPKQGLPLNPLAGLSTTHIGKAGEFAVVSELLFRGYNANSMTVDDGIDIFASKDEHFFLIQVKTTAYKDNVFTINIEKNSYQKYNASYIFYVIVIRCINNNLPVNQYLILGARDIEKLAANNLIGQTEKCFTISLRQANGDICISRGGKTESVKFHLNNFDWIK